MNGCAPGLALIERLKATRKWVITQWDLQNKGKSGWTGTSSFVLEVPLRNLRPSVIYSVPCDRIVQRAY